MKPANISFKLLPSPSITLSDVTVTTLSGIKDSIGRIEIQISMKQLMLKKLVVERVSVTDLHMPSFLESIPPIHSGGKNSSQLGRFLDINGDTVIEIHGFKTDLFDNADISVFLSPQKKHVSGDAVIENLKSLNPVLMSRIASLTGLQSFTADHADIRFSSYNMEDFDIKLLLSNLNTELGHNRLININSGKLEGSLAIDKSSISASIDSEDVRNTASALHVDFHGDRKNGGSSITFSGENVNVSELHKAADEILPGNFISERIFDIIQSGDVGHISVSFRSSTSTSAYTDEATNVGAGSAAGSSVPSNPIKRDKIKSDKKIDIRDFFTSESMKSLFDPAGMIIRGNISKGKIKIPGTELLTEETSGSVTVLNGILHTDNAAAKLESSSVNRGSLNVDLIHEKHSFSGEFDITAEMNHLKNVLEYFLPAGISNELGMIRKISGSAEGTLRLEGESHHSPSVLVSVKNMVMTGEYDRFPDSKFDVNGGSLNFDGNIISINNLDGKIGRNSFEALGGSITLDGQYNLSLSSERLSLDVGDLLPWLKSSLENYTVITPESDVTGAALDKAHDFEKMVKNIYPMINSSEGKIVIREPQFTGNLFDTASWDYSFNGDYSGLNIKNDKKSELSGLEGSFFASPGLQTLNVNRATIDDFSLITAIFDIKSRIAMSIDDIVPPVIMNDFEFRNVRGNKDTHTASTLKGQASLQCGTAISFEGETGFEDSPAPSEDEKKGTGQKKTDDMPYLRKSTCRFKVEIAGSDSMKAAVIYDSEKDPSFDFDGIINTAKLVDCLKEGSMLRKSIENMTDGRNFIIESGSDGHYDISTDNLDFDYIMNRQKFFSDSANKDNLPPLIPNSKRSSIDKELPVPLSVTLQSRKFNYKKVSIEPFKAEVKIDESRKKISIPEMKLCNIDGQVDIDISKSLLRLAVILKDEDRDIEPVVNCLYHGERLMYGRYSIDARLNSKASMTSDSDKMRDMKKNLSGSISLKSEGGRIFRLTLLSRILSVINISKLMEGKLPDIEQNGFAYNSINIDAVVDKGKIVLKKAVINGIDMTLLFFGWIDPFSREIELTCLVAPFKTADSLIEKIPVINRMLGGRLISVPVKAEGTFNNPDVTVLPPSEVGKGIINTMRDIITTPFKLLDLTE